MKVNACIAKLVNIVPFVVVLYSSMQKFGSKSVLL